MKIDIKTPTILYFILGPVPTAQDIAASIKLSPAQVRFRNAQGVLTGNHSLEPCDGVAGEVPEIYSKAYPAAETVLEKYMKSVDALTSNASDISEVVDDEIMGVGFIEPKAKAARAPYGSKVK